MIFGRICWLITFAIFFLPKLSQAFDLTEFFLINKPLRTSQLFSRPTIETSGRVSFGGGIAVDMAIFDQIGIEPAVIYLSKSFSSDLNPETNYSLSILQFPILARYRFSNKFSAGAGIYFERTAGEIPGGQLINPVLSWEGYDFGFTTSARYRAPLNDLINIVVDIRFLFGTNSLDTTNTGLQFRDFQTWLGITYNL